MHLKQSEILSALYSTQIERVCQEKKGILPEPKTDDWCSQCQYDF